MLKFLTATTAGIIHRIADAVDGNLEHLPTTRVHVGVLHIHTDGTCGVAEVGDLDPALTRITVERDK